MRGHLETFSRPLTVRSNLLSAPGLGSRRFSPWVRPLLRAGPAHLRSCSEGVSRLLGGMEFGWGLADSASWTDRFSDDHGCVYVSVCRLFLILIPGPAACSRCLPDSVMRIGRRWG